MLEHIIIENSAGARLELTNNRGYNILDISGTSPPVAAINTVDIVGKDGSLFNSARAQQRNLVFTLAIHHPVEQNRMRLYQLFRIKDTVTIFYKTGSRDVHITGYVESIENNPFTQVQQPQISIICPQPYWLANDVLHTDFSESTALFEFPFSITAEGIEFSEVSSVTSRIVNAGEIAVGGIITFYAAEAGISNPIFYNTTTNEFIGVNVAMQQGDLITINTNTGEKSITLLRNGAQTNLLANRMTGSSWLQFVSGENQIEFDATFAEGVSEDSLRVELDVVQKFEGV